MRWIRGKMAGFRLSDASIMVLVGTMITTTQLRGSNSIEERNSELTIADYYLSLNDDGSVMRLQFNPSPTTRAGHFEHADNPSKFVVPPNCKSLEFRLSSGRNSRVGLSPSPRLPTDDPTLLGASVDWNTCNRSANRVYNLPVG